MQLFSFDRIKELRNLPQLSIKILQSLNTLAPLGHAKIVFRKASLLWGILGGLLSLIFVTGLWAQTLDNLLPDAIIDPGNKPGIIMVVDKSRQELYLYSHDGRGNFTFLRVIPCSTGMVQGDKMVRGDKKTPDGYYIFNQKLLPQELPEIYGILAYPMNYPNFWDRKIGRQGSGIWTHGVNKPLVDYDSNGCIELLNHDLASLEDLINLHETPIILYENLLQKDQKELQREAENVRFFLEKWRSSWANKDHDTYQLLYSRDFFNTEKLSYDAWMAHKRNVAAGYQIIRVILENLTIFRHRDVIVATFTQRYQGDSRYESHGLKRLYLKPQGDSYLIVAEEFVGSTPPPTQKRLTPAERYAALNTPPLSVASLAKPLVTASAGVLVPGLLPASPRTQYSTDSAQEEQERVALEARARNHPEATDASPREPLLLAAQSNTSSSNNTSSNTSNNTTNNTTNSTTSIRITSSGPPITEGTILADSRFSTLTPAAQTSSRDNSNSSAKEPEVTTLTPDPAPSVPPLAALAPASPTVLENPVPLTPEERQAQVLKRVEDWVAAWESRDSATFFSFYAEDFYFPDKNMRFPAFQRYRERLFKKASLIQVKISKAVVVLQDNRAKVTFTQDYTSDNYTDRGVKTLSFEEREGRWLITSETFKLTP
ncbi:MAG: L,D-transpeptidase family protein [Deltaproteobacteria bacterium]|nr:L,D-transpeptidase family protein [Deltaproteobacteria bacterium]